MTIYSLLETEGFREKTAMYIGDRKISTLYNFLNGAFFALEIHGIKRNANEPDFSKFHDWVAEHYNWNESTIGWKDIILKECNYNEELAVDEFFKLYDIFIISQKL